MSVLESQGLPKWTSGLLYVIDVISRSDGFVTSRIISYQGTSDASVSMNLLDPQSACLAIIEWSSPSASAWNPLSSTFSIFKSEIISIKLLRNGVMDLTRV
jgi:hypothetical protein